MSQGNALRTPPRQQTTEARGGVQIHITNPATMWAHIEGRVRDIERALGEFRASQREETESGQPPTYPTGQTTRRPMSAATRRKLSEGQRRRQEERRQQAATAATGSNPTARVSRRPVAKAQTATAGSAPA